MATRVTVDEVAAILPGVVSDNEELQPYIDVATLIVTEELALAGHSSDRLKQIELYLSAHFAVITLERGGMVKQKVGDAEETYQVPGFNTVGLVTTRFGQQVVILDSSGKLAALSQKPVKAIFRVYGDPTP